MTKIENKNLHNGHRQRLKDKVRKFGLSSLAKHEVLEYLLMYSIPRKDTNDIAHELINTFGSFVDVFAADYSKLKNVNGVGEETALFLKSLGEFVSMYQVAENEKSTHHLNNLSSTVKYFRQNFLIKGNEILYVLCLSKTNKVVSVIEREGQNDAEIKFNIKDIAKDLVSDKNTTKVIMMHTHPSGEVNPSVADIEVTNAMVEACFSLGLEFSDHIILNEEKHFSFNQSGVLSMLKSDFAKRKRTFVASNFAEKSNYYHNLPQIEYEKEEDQPKSRKKYQ